MKQTKSVVAMVALAALSTGCAKPDDKIVTLEVDGAEWIIPAEVVYAKFPSAKPECGASTIVRVDWHSMEGAASYLVSEYGDKCYTESRVVTASARRVGDFTFLRAMTDLQFGATEFAFHPKAMSPSSLDALRVYVRSERNWRTELGGEG